MKKVRVLIWDPETETSIGFDAQVNDDTEKALIDAMIEKHHVFVHNVTRSEK